MLPALPWSLSLAFILITLGALAFLLIAFHNRQATKTWPALWRIALGSSVWLGLQAILAVTGWYRHPEAMPPRLLLAIGPPCLLLIYLLISHRGKQMLDSLPLSWLTYLNTLRIGVEFVLYGLYLHKALPQILTFEGRNPDILVGLTAPLLAYFGLQRKLLGRKAILAWNFISLGILLNVVIHGILSAPSPLQRLAFGQPNIALFYFPFIWLPAFVVPLALFTHLVSIRRLWHKKSWPEGGSVDRSAKNEGSP